MQEDQNAFGPASGGGTPLEHDSVAAPAGARSETARERVCVCARPLKRLAFHSSLNSEELRGGSRSGGRPVG